MQKQACGLLLSLLGGLEAWGSPGLEVLVLRLTIQGLHRELQAQVVSRVDHPVVAGGCDVKHQPALLRSPEGTTVQQEEVRLPGKRRETHDLRLGRSRLSHPDSQQQQTGEALCNRTSGGKAPVPHTQACQKRTRAQRPLSSCDGGKNVLETQVHTEIGSWHKAISLYQMSGDPNKTQERQELHSLQVARAEGDAKEVIHHVSGTTPRAPCKVKP